MNAFNMNNNLFCRLFLIFHLLIQRVETLEDFIFPPRRHFSFVLGRKRRLSDSLVAHQTLARRCRTDTSCNSFSQDQLFGGKFPWRGQFGGPWCGAQRLQQTSWYVAKQADMWPHKRKPWFLHFELQLWLCMTVNRCCPDDSQPITWC